MPKSELSYPKQFYLRWKMEIPPILRDLVHVATDPKISSENKK